MAKTQIGGNDMTHKGELVRQRRLELDWTQAELERRSGVPATAISAIETGRYGLGKKWATDLGAALGIAPADLIDWPEPQSPTDAARHGVKGATNG